MKTLLFTSAYPTEQAPNRGTINVPRFGAISRRFEVRLVAPIPWRERAGRPWEWFSTPGGAAAGFEATFPAYRRAAEGAAQARALYRSVRRHVEQVRREFPFEVILAVGALPDAIAAARLARDFGCPLITEVTDADPDAIVRAPDAAPLVRQALGQSHRVITPTNACRDRVVEMGIPPERIIVAAREFDPALAGIAADGAGPPPEPAAEWIAALASATGTAVRAATGTAVRAAPGAPPAPPGRPTT